MPRWLALRPKKEVIYPSYWSQDKIDKTDPLTCLTVVPREYSLAFTSECMSIYYGCQYDDLKLSSTFNNHNIINYFWNEYTHVRRSLYDYNDKDLGNFYNSNYDRVHSVIDNIKRQKYKIIDVDGEIIDVGLRVEEREWHLGRGYFKWLKYLTKPLIRRSLIIEFSEEQGPKKGSYKGGTIEGSIDMFKNESRYDALNRYCDKHNIKSLLTPVDAINYIDTTPVEKLKELETLYEPVDEICKYVKSTTNINKNTLKSLVLKHTLEYS